MADELSIPDVAPIPDFERPIGQPNPPVVTGPKIEITPLVPSPQPLRQPAPPAKPPATQGGLTDFWLFVMIFVAFGLAALANALTDFLNWLRLALLGPILRSRTPPKLDPAQVTQALTAPLGEAIQTADPAVGGSFAQLGSLAAEVGHEIAANAQVAAQTAEHLSVLDGSQTGLKRTVGHTATQTRQAVVTLQRQQHASDVRQTAQIQHVTHLIEPELEALRHEIPQLRKGLTTAWTEIRKHEELLGAAGMAAGVGGALTAIGASWIECEANKILGKAACGKGPNFWRKLLGGALDVFGVAELCLLTKSISAFLDSGFVQSALRAFTVGINDLIVCQGNARPKPLAIPAPSLGPLTAWATLAPVSV